MSNRQLFILGFFALACCTVIGLLLQTKPAAHDEVQTVGRYQIVGLSREDGSNVVVLDTTTGQAWLLRTHADLKDPQQWKSLGSPQINAGNLRAVSVTVPQAI